MDPDSLRSLLDIFTRGKYQTSEDLPPLTSGDFMEDINSLNAFLNPPLSENVEAPGLGLLEYLGIGPIAGPKNLSQLAKALKVTANSPKHSAWVSGDYIPTWTSYGKGNPGSVGDILMPKSVRQSLEGKKMMKNIINHRIAEGRKLIEKYEEAERVLKKWRKTGGSR